MNTVMITEKTVKQFTDKLEEAQEFFKQLEQLTRQTFGTEAKYDDLTLKEKSSVMESYIKYGGSLD